MFGLFGGDTLFPILLTIFLGINSILRALFPSIFNPNADTTTM